MVFCRLPACWNVPDVFPTVGQTVGISSGTHRAGVASFHLTQCSFPLFVLILIIGPRLWPFTLSMEVTLSPSLPVSIDRIRDTLCSLDGHCAQPTGKGGSRTLHI